MDWKLPVLQTDFFFSLIFRTNVGQKFLGDFFSFTVHILGSRIFTQESDLPFKDTLQTKTLYPMDFTDRLICQIWWEGISHASFIQKAAYKLQNKDQVSHPQPSYIAQDSDRLTSCTRNVKQELLISPQ